MSPTKATKAGDRYDDRYNDPERTPVETPLPSRYAKCAIHEEVVGNFKDAVGALDAKLGTLGGKIDTIGLDLAELKGHALVAFNSVERLEGRIHDTATASAGTRGKLSSVLTLIIVSLGGIGGGIAAGVAIARSIFTAHGG